MGKIEKRAGRRAGAGKEKERAGELYQTPLVARPLFRSSPLTESLEQATVWWKASLVAISHNFPRV